jgi:hypothetical protein
MVRAHEGANGLTEGKEISLQGIGDLHGSALLLELSQSFEGEERGRTGGADFGSVVAQDTELGLVVRQSHRDREQEAVKLGFVATTRKGSGRGRVVPSTVTCRSFIASSRDD